MRILHGVIVAILLAAVPARASDQIGVYAYVQSVVLEPDAANATRVQLHGWFSIANTNNGSYYAPVAGYAYYECPKGQEATCRMEWADMETYRQAGDCFGYGSRWGVDGPGVIRAPGAPPANPDVYPIAMGVVRVNKMAGSADGMQACNAMKLLAGTQPDLGVPPDLATGCIPSPDDLGPSCPMDLSVPPSKDMAHGAEVDQAAAGDDLARKPPPDIASFPTPASPADCGCTVGGAGPGAGPWALVLLLIVAVRRRR